jgi:hypothetical protein
MIENSWIVHGLECDDGHKLGPTELVLKSDLDEERRSGDALMALLAKDRTRVSVLETALARARDTFWDFSKMFGLLGKPRLAEGSRLAYEDAKTILDVAPYGAASEQTDVLHPTLYVKHPDGTYSAVPQKGLDNGP